MVSGRQFVSKNVDVSCKNYDANLSREYDIESFSKCTILDHGAEWMTLVFQQHFHERCFVEQVVEERSK